VQGFGYTFGWASVHPNFGKLTLIDRNAFSQFANYTHFSYLLRLTGFLRAFKFPSKDLGEVEFTADAKMLISAVQ
jgi:hypothetical protein